MKRSLAVVLVCVVLLVVSPGLVGAQDYDADCLDEVVPQLKSSELEGKAWAREARNALDDCLTPLLKDHEESTWLSEVDCEVAYIHDTGLSPLPIMLVVTGDAYEEVDFWLTTPAGRNPNFIREDSMDVAGGGVDYGVFFYRAYSNYDKGVFRMTLERGGAVQSVRFDYQDDYPVAVFATCN